MCHTDLLCVQWKTLDDGKRNCPKHAEFYSKNKFEKIVHLVGVIIRIYHDARSPECQIESSYLCPNLIHLHNCVLSLIHSRPVHVRDVRSSAVRSAAICKVYTRHGENAADTFVQKKYPAPIALCKQTINWISLNCQYQHMHNFNVTG